jgi:hypothetical protein
MHIQDTVSVPRRTESVIAARTELLYGHKNIITNNRILNLKFSEDNTLEQAKLFFWTLSII